MADVLTLMPGVTQDQNHVLQFEVNGVALPLDMFGQPSFISLLNPVFIKQADLLTGVLPAQTPTRRPTSTSWASSSTISPRSA